MWGTERRLARGSSQLIIAKHFFLGESALLAAPAGPGASRPGRTGLRQPPEASNSDPQTYFLHQLELEDTSASFACLRRGSRNRKGQESSLGSDLDTLMSRAGTIL